MSYTYVNAYGPASSRVGGGRKNVSFARKVSRKSSSPSVRRQSSAQIRGSLLSYHEYEEDRFLQMAAEIQSLRKRFALVLMPSSRILLSLLQAERFAMQSASAARQKVVRTGGRYN